MPGTKNTPNLIYTGSPYILTQNLPISPIIPTVTGIIETCSSDTELPSGLILDTTTCAISGTPDTLQPATSYTITANSSIGRAETTIIISISTAHTIGGTVTGLLAGTSIIIRNNGTDDNTISTNGAYSFSLPISNGANYNVTIQSQPTNTRCIVQNGSGTVNGNVTNIIVTCPVAIKNGLSWMRCIHGQLWNAATGDCTGTGSPSSYGATGVQYCNSLNNSCNDASPLGEGSTVYGHLNGAGTSSAWNACHSLNTANSGAGTYGITSWRIPRKSELMGLVYCSNGTPTPLADNVNCGAGYSSPTIDTAMFPNIVVGVYWSSSTFVGDQANAWIVSFNNGYNSYFTKSENITVRCVAGP
ncbi:DUF1566 domain-containing protein [Leptospira sp. 96542]|nr:DUF1566 domain-containing protein [Leptospira sp. 96542]